MISIKIKQTNFINIVPDNTEDLTVSSASTNDIDGILVVAASVGNVEKDHTQGFLLNNYRKNEEEHYENFKEDVDKSDFFFVIKLGDLILGFLLAYSKSQWLDQEPDWLSDTNWKDDFETDSLKRFLILEKIAVHSNLTGKGIGTLLFEKYREEAEKQGIKHMFSETILAPEPNFASMEFAMKQDYELAGVRYEEFEDDIFTTIVYHKEF